ncbi:NAD(P)H-binding protein [Alkalihalobacterium alkalinitrilicum]|uniref:NAD(P)H-binding protein n=1 Tax=Alkalihalobacterium alkalinitrilicum TaxID=427920 RepID=UPI0009950108|nr:NAD(P)H-binding protein [Alkalihalobacterium alkalinitrilicum]
MKGKSALIAGATGLVGNELLHFLLNGNEYERVIAIVRKPLEIEHPKLKEVVCNFDKLEEIESYFEVDDVFCCLGTTIKKAKSKEAMYKVDVEYPLAIAKLAKEQQVNHFLLVSSMNANPKSALWYSKIKGILEEELKKIPFEKISIFRPSLLLGNRKEFRMAENIAGKVFRGLSVLFKGPWKSRLAIEGKTVAQAMYEVAQSNSTGVKTYSAQSMEGIKDAKKG